MKELLFSSRDIQSEEGRKYKLNYYLLVEDVSGKEGNIICENYGVIVSNESEGKQEKIEILNITMSTVKIQNLLKLLSDNFVTSTTTYDVIVDWL